MKNAQNNGIQAERIDAKQLEEIEPFAEKGPAAIYCPSTSVIDSLSVVQRIKSKLQQHGVTFLFNCSFKSVNGKGCIKTSLGQIRYGYLVNCAGAYADGVAKVYGLADEYEHVPFKGIYWKLSETVNHKVRANIYPVPDISLPFLGVHFTRVISGDVYVGPTAIPAFGRENYGILRGVNPVEFLDIGYQFVNMFLRNQNNFRKLVHLEISKYRKKNFPEAGKKLLPSLKIGDLVPTSKVGIRPQLVNTKTRKLEMDYILCNTDDSLHVLNGISPAFTGSLAFAELIVSKAGI